MVAATAVGIITCNCRYAGAGFKSNGTFFHIKKFLGMVVVFNWVNILVQPHKSKYPKHGIVHLLLFWHYCWLMPVVLPA